jgi:hypothetical protein
MWHSDAKIRRCARQRPLSFFRVGLRRVSASRKRSSDTATF